MIRPAALPLVLLLAACTKAEATVALDASPPPATATASGADVIAEPPAPATPPPPAPAPARKTYKRVLHTGDSMVGGGLARALGPKFEAEGAKYYRDVIESGTIHDFSQSDHLPKLIARIKPDLIVLTLGANHVPHSLDPEKEIGPYVAKLLKRVAGVDCYWIAPPLWKKAQVPFNEWLRAHVAPCRFYDAAELEIARRADKIHPNEKGGEVWAEDFWSFYKGPGAFVGLAPP